MHVLWLRPSNSSILPRQITHTLFLHNSLTFGTMAYSLTGEAAVRVEDKATNIIDSGLTVVELNETRKPPHTPVNKTQVTWCPP